MSTRFIDFLDSYNTKIVYNELENNILNTIIQCHFIEANLSDPAFSGKKPVLPQKKIDISQNHFSYWHQAMDPEPFSLFQSKYSIWQTKHEADVDFLLSPNIRPKPRVIIDASMQTISDVISVIENTEYSENNEYNIDLKALCNIKSELIQLNSMIGMESMKKSVLEQLIYFVQELHVGKDKETSDFKHTVIYGPPGTGKTEIAKIIGKMYSKLGILKNNIFKKVTRNDLIAGYLGQTAIKTRKVIDECIGGVIFIDEAYSLANSEREDSYSKECLDILCESLSDHKNDLMVIIAGYEDELNDTFFRVNKGLESRFIWRFTMEEYNAKELLQIFKKKVLEIGWIFENETSIVEKWFEDKKANFKHFGRDMELLLTYVKIGHGRRVYGKDSELRKKITLEDMNQGYDVFLKNKRLKKDPAFMHGIYV
jgi:SpoVK/Ycf46/Vps4 family AAA+-type ATPase